MSRVVEGSRVSNGLAMARTKNSLPLSLGSSGEMSMTILAERRYLRTESRQTEDLSTRPAAHRLSILSDVGC
jgi:hypothetical protein